MSKDNINPDYYKKGDVECISALEAATVGKTGIEAVCTASIIKYLWRYEDKNGLEDVRKGMWYLQRLIGVLEARERKYPLTPEECYKEAKEDKLRAMYFHDLNTGIKIFVGDKYKSKCKDDDSTYAVKSFDFNKKEIYLDIVETREEIIRDIEDFLENYEGLKEVSEIPSNSLEGQNFIFNESQKIFKSLMDKKFRKLKTNVLFTVLGETNWGIIRLESVAGVTMTASYFELMDETIWKQEDS